MGFCTPHEYRRFLHQCPIFERLLVEDGIMLRKYWFSVSDAEQQRRFRVAAQRPDAAVEASPMDLESITRWEDYSRAKDEMMVHTDIPEAPWYVVESDDKRRARLNMMAHLLSTIPYAEVPPPTLSSCPTRPPATGLRAAAARADDVRAGPQRQPRQVVGTGASTPSPRAGRPRCRAARSRGAGRRGPAAGWSSAGTAGPRRRAGRRPGGSCRPRSAGRP